MTVKDLARVYDLCGVAESEIQALVNDCWLILRASVVAAKEKAKKEPVRRRSNRYRALLARRAPLTTDEWMELYHLERTRRRVRFDFATRTVTVQACPHHRRSPDRALTGAITLIVERWIGWDPYRSGTGTYSPVWPFAAAILKLANPELTLSPGAIRSRYRHAVF